jgi:hypothetical protein
MQVSKYILVMLLKSIGLFEQHLEKKRAYVHEFVIFIFKKKTNNQCNIINKNNEK